jgi:hypothetical protein
MALASPVRSRLQASLASAATLALWWRRPGPPTATIAAIAAGLALVAWFFPRVYAPVQRGLDHLTHAIVAAVSWVILALVYFGLFAPLRAIRWMAGKPSLQMRRDPAAATYLAAVRAGPRSFERQF